MSALNIILETTNIVHNSHGCQRELNYSDLQIESILLREEETILIEDICG